MYFFINIACVPDNDLLKYQCMQLVSYFTVKSCLSPTCDFSLKLREGCVLQKQICPEFSHVLFFIKIILDLCSVFFLQINAIPGEGNEKVHSGCNDKVRSPLTIYLYTYNSFQDIFIYTIFTCFESFDKAQSFDKTLNLKLKSTAERMVSVFCF